MPRRQRIGTGGLIHHVLNRSVEGLVLFDTPTSYERFLTIVKEGLTRVPVGMLAYVLMPNHWHMVLWPQADQALSEFTKWVTGKHAQTWRFDHGSQGRGAVYQGRYKAISVTDERHLVQLCRYVERNPLRARLVPRAQDWRWSSAATADDAPDRPPLTPWPIPRPVDWLDLLNLPEPPDTLADLRRAIRANRIQTGRSIRFVRAERSRRGPQS